MTFEEFQATRTETDDLESVIDDYEGGYTNSGYVYLEAVYIEKLEDGRFYVLDGTMQGNAYDGLVAAERALYDFCVGEEMF
jgi:hypothetical protein